MLSTANLQPLNLALTLAHKSSARTRGKSQVLVPLLTPSLLLLLLFLLGAGTVDEAGFLFSGQAGLQVRSRLSCLCLLAEVAVLTCPFIYCLLPLTLFACVALLQVMLLLVSFVAVPWMLVPKPLILKKRHEASQNVSTCPARHGKLSG